MNINLLINLELYNLQFQLKCIILFVERKMFAIAFIGRNSKHDAVRSKGLNMFLLQELILECVWLSIFGQKK